jgi:hypothetical protein
MEQACGFSNPFNTLSSFDSPLVRFPLASSGSSSRGLAQDDRVFPLASRFWRDTENVVSTGALRIRKFKTTFFPHLFSHRCKVQQAIQETAMTFPAICHPEAEPCSLSKAYTQLARGPKDLLRCSLGSPALNVNMCSCLWAAARLTTTIAKTNS